MGIIAPFARRNYYREAVTRLQGLRARLGGKKADYRILCNSPVPEKPLALASGLGALGRNGLIITPGAGSLVIIAAMTLPFALAGDGPEAGEGPFPRCAGCDRERPPCMAACPTGAVRGDGSLDLKRCIQWYASGKEAAVPVTVAEKWGRRLYGCTACQDACVHNRRPIQGAETALGPLPAALDLRDLLAQSDPELKARFKGTTLGLSWLGPGAIRRNARLALDSEKGEVVANR
jgi:epoxyqueuosine reductase